MELPSPVPSGSPAPYGQACTNCARAKCKCIVAAHGRCQRCHRLDKECQPAAAIRRKGVKRSTAASRTSQLEDKLDSIVSLLVNGPMAHQSEGFSASAISGSSAGSSPFNGPFASSSLEQSSEPLRALRTVEPPFFEAEELLQVFRRQHLRSFPFMYIPPTTSAQKLLQERPFLWHCVMAVTSPSTTQQLAIGEKVRRMVAQKMLIEFENNLDLLLGLLTYMGWHQFQLLNKPSSTQFTQLAMSLVFDLGLNKPPMHTPHASASFHSTAFTSPHDPPVRSMEERRAVLGCFLLSSMLANLWRRLDPLRWTPHMDECLEVLADKAECPTDIVLVHQVRLQLILDRAAQIPQQTNNFTGSLHVPPAFYVKALQAELQEVRSTFHESEPSNAVLLFFYSTQITISEIGFSKVSASGRTDLWRVESLHSALDAIKAFFDVFFAIPLAEYRGLPFSIFSRCVQCFMTLYTLSTLDEPGWDKGLVRNKVDLLEFLDLFASNLRQVNSAAGLDDNTTSGNFFVISARFCESLRRRWEAKLVPGVANVEFNNASGLGADMADSAMDFSLDNLLSDIFVPWEG